MARSTPLLLGEVADRTHLQLVRQALSVELRRLGLPDERVDDALVMVSELAANALEHTDQPAQVRLSWTDDDVMISVFDQSDGAPVPQPSDPSRPGGRGLLIVEAYADRFGVDLAAGGGKAVWFAMDRHRQATSR